MRQKIIAKTIVYNADGWVLLLRRSMTDDKRPGEWDFPGGEIEAGEDFTFGAIREVKEEAGLAIHFDDMRLVHAETTIYDDLHAIRLVYAVQLENPEVTLSFEHDNHQWVPQDKVLEEFPHPVYGKAFEAIGKYQLMNIRTRNI